MRLLRYGPKGREKPGLVDVNNNVRDLSHIVSDIDGTTIRGRSLRALGKMNHDELPIVAGEQRWGPCVSGVGKFICIGLNYVDHALETGAEIPQEPVIFMKATSSITGPNDPILKPHNSTKLDWEVELGIVIGEPVCYADESEASNAIAGYCVINDVSERAFQIERGGQWTKGKGCDSFGPIGPWLVTPDEIEDVQALRLYLEVNGKRYQDSTTANMIFSPSAIVSYLSQFMSLQPGDVISSGTPPGVGLGQNPPVYLNIGDRLQLGIDSLGEQSQFVVETK